MVPNELQVWNNSRRPCREHAIRWLATAQCRSPFLQVVNRFLETMHLLEREPQKWLAQRSVLHVDAFLSGFHLIATLGAVNLDPLAPLCTGFTQYLERKYGGYMDYNWQTAVYQSGYDDEDAFLLYFKEWHGFYDEWARTSRPQSIRTGVGSAVNLWGFLDQAKPRVGMYFAGPSTQLLYSLIRGLQRACDCYNPGARIEPDFREYETWLSGQAPLRKPCRWDRLLLAESGFNEQAAFTRFFETLKDFTNAVKT